MAHFERLTVGPATGGQLARLKSVLPDVYRCVLGELERIVSDDFEPGELLPDLVEPRLHGHDCCQMTLLLSTKSSRVHLVGIVPARNALRGILP